MQQQQQQLHHHQQQQLVQQLQMAQQQQLALQEAASQLQLPTWSSVHPLALTKILSVDANSAAAAAAFHAAASAASVQYASLSSSYSLLASHGLLPSPFSSSAFHPYFGTFGSSSSSSVPLSANSPGNSGTSITTTSVSKELMLNGFSTKLTNKNSEKRKILEELTSLSSDVKKAKYETKALKAKRPGFTDDRYNETAYYVANGLRKVYPYYFTFTTFTKGRWVGEKILEVFGREFRAHPVEEYQRCILDGTLTVNYTTVDLNYRLRHNDLLANIVHRHETPVLSKPIEIVHLSDDLVVLDKPCSLPVHPCGRYRHNTVVFILAKEYNLKNLRTIHRLDRLTSGLLMFGRNPKKAKDMESQIKNRLVLKEYICRVEGEFPEGRIECSEAVEVLSYKIGVCKVSSSGGKECRTEFQRMSFNGTSSVVLCKPFVGRMHQIRVHLQFLGFPVLNDPLYNHVVFGKNKGKDGNIGKTDETLISDLISIHNAENWLGMDGEPTLSMFGKNSETHRDSESRSPLTSRFKDIYLDTSEFSNVPKNCAITRPPPITRPGKEPIVLRAPLENDSEPIREEDNDLLSRHKDYKYVPDKMTWDPNCYECRVKYRDPKVKDLVMYLHAWRYKGPDWEFTTSLPDWAEENWFAN